MKLVSCYIAHFGKIKDFTYNFEDGFNSLLKENGWGKTTFSVFIKSMFYGMEYSPNTRKKLLDRNHYMPWDGSVCGGNIVVRIKGREYRIERTFGKTDRDDTFALYDNATGLLSDDYGRDIGEELFRVDRDSFEKSVYIPQLSLATGMTDSLNAKMGNLSSAKDDISNFDIALKSVKDARSEYTRNSKINPGKLHAVKQEINKCKEDYEKLPDIQEGYEAMSCLMEEKLEQLDKLNGQKNELIELIQNQSKKEQELGAYRAHKDTLASEKEVLSELDDFFAAGIPEDEELDVLENTERDLAVHERSVNVLKEELERGERVFAEPFKERIPDDSEFAMWNKNASKLAELRAKAENSRLSEEANKQLTELKFFFDKLLPTDEQLSTVEKQTTRITGLEARIDQSRNRLLNLRAERDANEKVNRRRGFSVWHILGIILLVIFILMGVVFSNYIGDEIGKAVEIASLVAAIVDVLLLILLGRKSKFHQERIDSEYDDRIHEVEDELEMSKLELREIQEECEDFLSNFLLPRADTMQENVYYIRRSLDQYRHLLDEEQARHNESEDTLDELADLQLELYTKIQPFASAYGINLYDMGGEYEFLAQLKKDADRYTKYLEESEEISRHENSIRTLSADINNVLDRYPLDKALDRGEKIQDLRMKSNRYNALVDRIDNLKQGIQEFEAKYDVNEQVLSVDDLQNQQNSLDEQIVELNRQIMQEKENISTAATEIERLGDVSEQLERLEEKATEYKEKAELLEMTEDFLQKARESFLLKYMQPLQTGLHKYLSLLDSPEGTKSGYAIEDFELDMDLNIKLSYSGSTKTSEYLSQGYQDLVALCSRLALVDVLYSDEKPILILDDPFTNLDDKKIKESLKLLQKIAQDRQTIYFTCHDSRL